MSQQDGAFVGLVIVALLELVAIVYLMTRLGMIS